MKYAVTVPVPETERFRGQPRRVRVKLWSGWEAFPDQKFEAPAGDRPHRIEFEVPDAAQPTGTTAVIDGLEFSVTVQYRNSTGSRTETRDLAPERVG